MLGAQEKATSHTFEISSSPNHSDHNGEATEISELNTLGYKTELVRNRSMLTLLFQSLAIAAIPYGEGAPILSAVVGGGPLSIFVGWIVVVFLAECIAISLSELASRYPTSAGPYYWSFQIAGRGRALLSFITGWTWLVGNWTITLSVTYGFASLLAAAIQLYYPDWNAQAWQLLLIFYGILIFALVCSAFGNKFLPFVDTLCAGFTAITIIVVLVALSATAKVGRHSASYALGHYDTTLSGWGGFTFFIGLLPAAYSFSAIGMISSMAEECADPAVKVPWAISLAIPVLGVAGLFFVLPICFTLPDLSDIITNSPTGQALPYIFATVMDSPGGGVALTVLVLIVTLFCAVSITVAASRTTWAFARDKAIPLHHIWSKIDERLDVPLNALLLVTLVQALLGLINLGSSSAFFAFVSVGVVALAVSYAIPIIVSMVNGRREVMKARWNVGKLGWIINFIAVSWISFETVLFCMPTALPTTISLMNYASVVLVAFGVFAAVYYLAYARKVYIGPPPSDGL